MSSGGHYLFSDQNKIGNINQAAFSALGGWPGYFLDGCGGSLFALLIFVILDFLIGMALVMYTRRKLDNMVYLL